MLLPTIELKICDKKYFFETYDKTSTHLIEWPQTQIFHHPPFESMDLTEGSGLQMTIHAAGEDTFDSAWKRRAAYWVMGKNRLPCYRGKWGWVIDNYLFFIIGHMWFANVITFMQNEHEQVDFSDACVIGTKPLHKSDWRNHHTNPKEDTLRSCKIVTERHAVRLVHELDPQQ